MERISTQKQQENDALRVPQDIIENILIRQPVKSLLRFKAVSKTWEATISDPVFARFHLQQSKISARRYIFLEENKPRQRGHDKFKLVRLKNKRIQVDTKLDYPSDIEEAYFMCYSDGLLLLTCYKECSFPWHTRLYALWNPSTMTFTTFGCPYLLCYRPRFYGFCYDPWIEDYKVVIGDKIHYAVFNCKNRYWTKVKELPISGCQTDPQGVCYNGSLYWVLNEWDQNGQYLNYEIIRFDPRHDTFKKVRKPDGLQNDGSLSLVLLGGHLCLYYNSSDQLFILKKDDDRNSWKEFITIDIAPSIYYLRPLFMTDENEIILFIDGSKQYFVAYNPSKITFKKIKICSIHVKSIIFPFVESLMMGRGCSRRFGMHTAFEELREVFFLT